MLSMYQASVPVFVRMLGNLRVILQKGSAHAEAKKFDPSVLAQARLAPDMFPLTRQVQIATDQAKGCAARLAGIEPPKFEDNEATMDDLLARIDKTVAFVNSIKAEQIDGSEKKNIVLQMRTGEMKFEGQPYLLNFVLPNFYFHIATAYNLLRHNGVDVGKKDFLGGI